MKTLSALILAAILTGGAPVMALAQGNDAAPVAATAEAPAAAPTPATDAKPPGEKNTGDAVKVASEIPTPADKAEADPVGTATQVVTDIKAGNWRDAAAGVLALLMFVLVRVRDRIKWFAGDRGGAVLVMTLSLAGTLSIALVSEAAIDWRMILGVATTTWTAVGAVSWFKRVIWPPDQKQAS